ncbi:alpha/beta hydrolase [Castellaniella sp. GW247-6E4]|uniref:alpha/beta fold hydrolase n=1 Tax=Castellaniella sp. GW247-6E4 TaxID=3140380 RepID=UPI003315B4BC
MVNVEIEPIVGRYLRLEIGGAAHRVYIEEAGSGIPLLCLHTAGTDGRQYRSLLNDAEVAAKYRVIVFDMPWHGKSSPPEGFQNEHYVLTRRYYMDTIMAVVRGLDLHRPVVIGCSIGGRAVLHLLLEHPQLFGGAIGLQTTRHSASRLRAQTHETAYLDRPDVNGGEATAGWLSGIMAPTSPAVGRWETLWHYMQGGPGIFYGDTMYYREGGDIALEELGMIDTRRTPLYLLTGEYDYSATPEMTAEVAARIPGAKFQRMENLGHFPMSENYSLLRTYLWPVLQEIHAIRKA